MNDKVKIIKIICRMCKAKGAIQFDWKRDPEEIVKTLEEWAKEHPEKTYKDDFLEKFPNVRKSADGCPTPCRKVVYGGMGCNGYKCKDCWNVPMEAEE